MSHSITEVDICNQSLGKLGLKFISDAGSSGLLVESGDVTESGLLLQSVYPATRDAVLSEVAWRFAEARLVLEPSETAPVWGSTSTVYEIPEGDNVGPDRMGARSDQASADVNLSPNYGYWYWRTQGVTSRLNSDPWTIGLSFRFDEFPSGPSENYFRLMKGAGNVEVFVKPDGYIVVNTNNPDEFINTGKRIYAGTVYYLVVTTDGAGEYTVSATPRGSTEPDTQYAGDTATTSSSWHLELGVDSDAVSPNQGACWIYNAYYYAGNTSSENYDQFWAIDESSGLYAFSSVGGSGSIYDYALKAEVSGAGSEYVPVITRRSMFKENILRVFRVYTDSAGTDPLGQAEWRQEQNTVVADHAGANLYALATKQITNPHEWSSLFSQAVVARLAAELSMALTRDTALYQLMWSEYASKLSLAKAMDGGAGRSEQQTSSKLLSSRMGGGGPFRLY